MNQGVYPLAGSMINQVNRLDMISNNLANMNSFGFKQEAMVEGTFNNYLQKAGASNNVNSENRILNDIPKLSGKYIDQTSGAVVQTQNELDFSLNSSDLFFKVQDQNGDIVYTRNGSFKVSDGFLSDAFGNTVLNNDNEPIVLEGNVEENLGVVKIDFQNLEALGQSKFKLKENTNIEQIMEDPAYYVTKGSVEKSNVNPVRAMVELIDAQRRFEQSQKAITSIDSLNANVIEKIGSNTK